MSHNDDILAAFDIVQEHENTSEILESESTDQEALSEVGNIISIEEETIKKGALSQAISVFIFLVKYLATSCGIFLILLGVANYSAYSNLIYSFLYAEEMQQTEQSLIQSVAAAEIQSETSKKEVNTFKQLDHKEKKEKTEYVPSMHSLGKLIAQTEQDDIDLGIEITPYENRIIIPKIGKNIPLVEIKQQQVEGIDELNDIFMEELENGVIRYPGSAKPGETGNSFIFGHSSNFPWLEGDYNDVFALLDNVVYDDKVIIYYGQEKHTYKISAKNVIRPGDVSVLKKESDDRSQITLMTCWPIGTTLNRLVLTGELISVE